MSITDSIKTRLGIDKSGFDYEHKDGNYVITSDGPHNVLGSLHDAISTLDNDPNGYKKKALLGAAGTIGSTALLSYLAKRGLKHSTDTSIPNKKLGLALLAAQLAGGYYAARNIDRPERAALGGSVLAGATLADMRLMKDLNRPVDNPIPGAIAGLGLGASTLYMVNNLQLADDQAKLEGILADPKLSDEQRIMEINRIREGKDLLTRYPLIRVAPYSEKLRTLYNKVHTPSTDVRGASDFIRMKVR